MRERSGGYKNLRFSADRQNIPLRSHALIVMLRMFTARPATKKKLTQIKPTHLKFVFGLQKDNYDFILGHFCLSVNFFRLRWLDWTQMTSISMKIYCVASCPLHLFSVSAYFISIARYHHLLADRTNGRAIGTLLCLSVCLSVVCDVMYCG